MTNFNYEIALVEERAVAQVQAMALRLIDEQGIKQRALAEALGVTEARVSQMFSAEPKNLTVKTAARLFFHLGEELMFSCAGIDRLNREADQLHAKKAAALKCRSRYDEWQCVSVNSNDKKDDRTGSRAPLTVAA